MPLINQNTSVGDSYPFVYNYVYVFATKVDEGIFKINAIPVDSTHVKGFEVDDTTRIVEILDIKSIQIESDYFIDLLESFVYEGLTASLESPFNGNYIGAPVYGTEV